MIFTNYHIVAALVCYCYSSELKLFFYERRYIVLCLILHLFTNTCKRFKIAVLVNNLYYLITADFINNVPFFIK